MRVFLILTTVILLLTALGVAAPAVEGRGGTRVPKNFIMNLPPFPGIESAWIIPPNLYSKEKELPLRRALDLEENPWYGYSKKYLINANSKIAFEVDQPYEDFAWLDGGQFVMCTKTGLGYLGDALAAEKKNEFAPPVLPFISKYSLPRKRYRLYPGVGDNLYFVGYDVRRRRSQVFLLQWGKREKGTNPIKALIELPGRVSSVAGNGVETYVAQGKTVFLIQGAVTTRFFTHKKNKLRDLAFSPEAGLFYTTRSSVGFVGAGSGIKLIHSPGVSIRMRGNILYVLLKKSLGVLRINGLEDFAGLRGGGTNDAENYSIPRLPVFLYAGRFGPGPRRGAQRDQEWGFPRRGLSLQLFGQGDAQRRPRRGVRLCLGPCGAGRGGAGAVGSRGIFKEG